MIPVHVHRFRGIYSKLYLYSITILRTVLYKEILLRVDNVYYDTFFQGRIPYFLGLAPLLGLAPPIRLQILISVPARVSSPPSDKCPLEISFDFDQISPPLG